MLRFEFHGGPKDGELLVADGNSAQAQAYVELTEGGRVGSVLWCTTEYYQDVVDHLSESALRDLKACGVQVRGHCYEAQVRRTENDLIRVKMRHLGPCTAETVRTAVAGFDTAH